MSKIINTKTKEVIYSKEGCTHCATVESFAELNRFVIVYEHLSELISTMVGEGMTPFNNIGELIKYIPDILTASEETVIIQLVESEQFFVLPYDYENDTKGWNKVLQSVHPEYSVVAE